MSKADWPADPGRPAHQITWTTAMMQVTYGDVQRTRPDLFGKLEQASRVLESVLGTSAGTTQAHWDLLVDQGPTGPRDLIRLRLKDGMTGDVGSADFAPDEFDRDSVLRYRFHDLWFDLLRQQTDRHRARFEQLISTEEGS